MGAKFYVTTPIYYVNDEPHIGHAYTTVLADALARFHRLRGDDTFFLTGTDEHGQKVQQAAEKRGISPLAHADEMVLRFQRVWERLAITHDDFIRTTEARHQKVVQELLQRLFDRGEIFRQRYEGLYCVPDERFWTEKDLENGKCPACGRDVVAVSEENYFFRMSAYQSWLIEHIEQNPTYLQPETRRNEVLGFLRKPLGDLCISRPKARLRWGIPLPFDSEYVTYVWFDALVNYYSAVLGRGPSGEDGAAWWPATLHLIGKDILTTHSVYWSTMLHAAGLPLPATILAHGWWLLGDSKMSKSVGNVVPPLQLTEVYGVDPFRYFLLRDMVVGTDAEFTEAGLVSRINADLANDLGNCLNRVERMIQTNAAGRVPKGDIFEEDDEAIARLAARTLEKAQASYEDVRLHHAIEEVLQFVRAINKYLEVKAPWKAVKEGGLPAIATTLWVSAEALRLAALLLSPIMPAKTGEMLYRLGVLDAPDAFRKKSGSASDLAWGRLAPGTEIRPGGPLFPRIETAVSGS